MPKFTITHSLYTPVYSNDRWSAPYRSDGHTYSGSAENDVDAVNQLLAYDKDSRHRVDSIESITWEE